jgi:hypothetical protein
MQTYDFNPQPLLQMMADSIALDYGQQGGLRIAEQAILKMSRRQDEEALQVWLAVHALLHTSAVCPRSGQTLH